MDITTNVHPTNNQKVHRTNLRPSPLPLVIPTRPRTRGPVGHIVPTIAIVTVLLIKTRITAHNYNHHRRHQTPKPSIRGPDTNLERPSTVENSVTVPLFRVGVWGTSSRIHGFLHLTKPVRVPGTQYSRQKPPTSVLIRPTRTRVRGVTTLVYGRYHPPLSH